MHGGNLARNDGNWHRSGVTAHPSFLSPSGAGIYRVSLCSLPSGWILAFAGMTGEQLQSGKDEAAELKTQLFRLLSDSTLIVSERGILSSKRHYACEHSVREEAAVLRDIQDEVR